MLKIAVFAGHGGTDPGAVGNGLQEKDLTLAISNATSKILRDNGYIVINNRTTDKNRSITRDALLANEEQVDALVEIHFNSSTSPTANGSEVFYSLKDTGKGKVLAQTILDNLVALGFSNRGVKTKANAEGKDAFGILRLTNGPSVLVEVAFISNKGDMERLDIDESAVAIADGVMEVFPKKTPPIPPVPPVPPVPPIGKPDPVISEIQKTLNSRYGLTIPVTGYADGATKKALVKGLQTELNNQYGRNLVVDGVFGPSTKAATVTVKKGARGNITYLIQSALYTKGYKVYPDAVFGQDTVNKVISFQNDNNLYVDGIAGPNTQEKLFK